MLHEYTQNDTNIYTLTYTYVCTHTHIHAYTYTHACVHTHTEPVFHLFAAKTCHQWHRGSSETEDCPGLQGERSVPCLHCHASPTLLPRFASNSLATSGIQLLHTMYYKPPLLYHEVLCCNICIYTDTTVVRITCEGLLTFPPIICFYGAVCWLH